jgi:hypothetical protein
MEPEVEFKQLWASMEDLMTRSEALLIRIKGLISAEESGEHDAKPAGRAAASSRPKRARRRRGAERAGELKSSQIKV